MKKLLALLGCVMAFCGAAAQSMPDVRVENSDGEIISTASLTGRKPLIISFWSITCKPCLQELNAINEQLEEWREKTDFDVVAVSIDDVRLKATAKARAAAMGWDFICLFDANQTLKRAMNVSLTPQSFVVDADGNIVFSHSGYTPGSEQLLIDKVIETSKKQNNLGEGQLSGSFETNTIHYTDDSKIGSKPTDHFGSNNYLKLDYTYGHFSAGIQADAYLPALLGYELGEQSGSKHFYLSSKYVQWSDTNFEVLIGDIFDQFGNGLVYRSYEDRQLGINTGVEGIRGIYRFGNYVSLKGLYGRPRLYTEYADSWVRGANINVSLTDIFGFQDILLSLEGSYINRHEDLDKDSKRDFAALGLTSPDLDLWSGGFNFNWKGFSLRGEYAGKGKDLSTAVAEKADDGRSVLGEIGFHHKGFSLSGAFRMLDNMGTMISLYGNGTGNVLNYLPALTRQYTYMLANLNPYQVNVEGEFGGQIDINYSLQNKRDRYRHWIFHGNLSNFYTLHKEQSQTGNREMLWLDVNFDVERQWNRKWKTNLLYSFQEWNPHHGFKHRTYVSNIFVADVTCKIDRKKSVRTEIQYLLSDEYEGDWVAGLVEFGLAPHWNFYFSDMYNKDMTKTNYCNGGFSYTKNRTRIQISYGRNRAGYICSGGVCRYSPAYTGCNVTITSSF